jgi:hypothetical protein
VDATELADLLTAELRAVGSPERALHERRYLKSELEFLGASVWEIRRDEAAPREALNWGVT